MGHTGFQELLREMKPRSTSIVALLVFAICSVGLVHAQKSSNAPAPRPFEPAEELVYEAEFSRLLLRKVDVADFKFTAGRSQPRGEIKASGGANGNSTPSALMFTGDITSKGFFSKLFNLRFRERVESTVDPLSFTVQNTKRQDEQGKRVRNSEAVFDITKGKVVWTEHDPNDPSRAPRVVSSEFKGNVQDVLSAIYFLRTQPLKVGKNLELLVSDSGQVYEVPIRVVERKRMKTVLGRVDTVRTDVGLFGDRRMINGEGQFSIWFTDDARRIPVSARIKNRIGTFDIKLKKVTRSPSPQQYLTQQDRPQ